MIYLDTSVLVAALTREPATERVQAWLTAQEGGELAISAWTHVEFAAALRFKAATGQIDERQRSTAGRGFTGLCETALVTWPVGPSDMEAAALIASLDSLGLRGPDALHLAMARRRGVILCTLDQRLARGCEQLGHTSIAL